VIGVTAAVVGGIVGTRFLGQREAESAPDRVLARQRTLPREAVAALQDLRLAAAVEMTFFHRRGHYGAIEELKSDGLLDPAWPRSAASFYRVACTVEQDQRGFVCHADPRAPQAIHFRVDATQAVRFQYGRRPDASSEVFR
jgi:hypothetical protein